MSYISTFGPMFYVLLIVYLAQMLFGFAGRFISTALGKQDAWMTFMLKYGKEIIGVWLLSVAIAGYIDLKSMTTFIAICFSSGVMFSICRNVYLATRPRKAS